MSRLRSAGPVVALAGALALLAACGDPHPATPHADEHGHDHGAAHGDAHHDGHDEPERGPHGGVLLRDGDFALEVTIFERGTPPELRVYPFADGRPVDPAGVTLAVALRRFGGRVDRFAFAPRDGALVGDGPVEEPHSFDVEVIATREGTTHRWTYASYEGRTEIAPEALARSGITIETAGAATIRTAVRLNGRVVPDENRLARVLPRFPGVVREVRARLGDAVARDQVLAVVESDQSLRAYPVTAPLAGTVIAKDVVTGQVVREDHALFTVADLASVWVELVVPPREAARLRVGQAVTVAALEGDATVTGTVVHLSPVGDASTQTLLARAAIPNADGAWRPGLFVTADVLIGEDEVAAAVRPNALQRFRDWDVVFVTDGTVFQAMPVELGRRDAAWVEVLDGVRPGDRYAAENSYVVKADVAKSGATHDH